MRRSFTSFSASTQVRRMKAGLFSKNGRGPWRQDWRQINVKELVDKPPTPEICWKVVNENFADSSTWEFCYPGDYDLDSNGLLNKTTLDF